MAGIYILRAIVMDLLCTIWFPTLYADTAMGCPEFEITVDLPELFSETGQRELFFTAEIINRSDRVVALRKFDTKSFSSDAIFSPQRRLRPARDYDPETWGNALAPGQKKTIILSKQFFPGRQELIVTLEYGLPSPEYLEDHLFEIIGKKMKGSGNYPTMILDSFTEKRPLLSIRFPEQETNGIRKRFEKKFVVTVSPDSVINHFRKKFDISAFVKDIPNFGYAFISGERTYLITGLRAQGIGKVSLEALDVLGRLIQDGSEIIIRSNYSDGWLGKCFLLTTIQADTVADLIQATALWHSGGFPYLFCMKQADLPALWKSLLADKSVLFESDDLYILREPEMRHQ